MGLLTNQIASVFVCILLVKLLIRKTQLFGITKKVHRNSYNQYSIAFLFSL